MKVYINCVELNRIVACFDLNKVEKMGLDTGKQLVFNNGYNKEACLNLDEAPNYIRSNYYYVWYIENLRVFKLPLYLIDFYKAGFNENPDASVGTYLLKKAPNNWMSVEREYETDCVLISLKAKMVDKILSGEQTIIIKKDAPKKVIKNEKNIRDLTEFEVDKICKKHHCSNCPLYELSLITHESCYSNIQKLKKHVKILDKKVVVDEKEY